MFYLSAHQSDNQAWFTNQKQRMLFSTLTAINETLHKSYQSWIRLNQKKTFHVLEQASKKYKRFKHFRKKTYYYSKIYLAFFLIIIAICYRFFIPVFCTAALFLFLTFFWIFALSHSAFSVPQDRLTKEAITYVKDSLKRFFSDIVLSVVSGPHVFWVEHVLLR